VPQSQLAFAMNQVGTPSPFQFLPIQLFRSHALEQHWSFYLRDKLDQLKLEKLKAFRRHSLGVRFSSRKELSATWKQTEVRSNHLLIFGLPATKTSASSQNFHYGEETGFELRFLKLALTLKWMHFSRAPGRSLPARVNDCLIKT